MLPVISQEWFGHKVFFIKRLQGFQGNDVIPLDALGLEHE